MRVTTKFERQACDPLTRGDLMAYWTGGRTLGANDLARKEAILGSPLSSGTSPVSGDSPVQFASVMWDWTNGMGKGG